MNALPRFFAFALLLAASPAAVTAALTWDTKELVVKVQSWSPGETVRFGFTNSGPTPVRITQIAPGCGCTQAKASRETVAPGERAEITAEFHPAGKTGDVRIPIRVVTDESADAETTLVLAASIAEGLRLEARFVYWKDGQTRETRKLRVTVLDATQVELGELETTQPGFTAKLRPVDGGQAGEYEIVVTPPATGGPAFSAVTLRTKEGPARVDRLYTILARTF